MMRIGEIAERAGVNVQTIRYYERRGLLEDPPRTGAGYRDYDPAVMQRIRFIRRAQDLGFTLKEIDELLDLRVDEPQRCQAVEQRAEAKLDQVRRKLRELQRMETVLGELLEACRARSTTDECPILAGLEEDRDLARQRTDPRA